MTALVVVAIGLRGQGEVSGDASSTALLGPYRTLEPRLTGSSGWARCRESAPDTGSLVPASTCGELPRPGSAEHRRLLAAGGALADDGTPASRWALGHWLLATGGDPDAAVGHLESAVEAAPRQGSYWSDLAAAYLERAARFDRPRDLARALAAAERAVELAPDAVPARFNRALAHEKLHLDRAALLLWRDLSRDLEPPWRREADERRWRLVPRLAATPERPVAERLDEALAGRAARREDPALWQEVREHVRGVLLPEWGSARFAGADTRPHVERLERAARLLTARSGDRLLADAVEQLTALPDADLDTLARGYAAYGEGAALFEERRFLDAAPAFVRAERELASVGSPLALWASHHLAIVARRRPSEIGELGEPLDRLDRIERAVGSRPYPVLLGTLDWRRCWILSLPTGLTRGRSHCRRARETLRGTAQPGDLVALDFQEAEIEQFLGGVDRAWELTYRALRDRAAQPSPAWRSAIVKKAAQLALEDGLPRASRRLATAALREAVASTPEPVFAAEALLQRARSRAELSDLDGLRRDLDAADGWAARVPDPIFRRLLVAQTASVRGRVLAETEPREAARAVDEAIRLYSENRTDVLLPVLLGQRGRIARIEGDRALARESLEESLALFERQRVRQAGSGSRVSFFEQVREVVDELVELEIEGGRPERALLTLERMRAKELRGAETGGGGELRDLAALTGSIPEDTAVVEYAITGRGAGYAWVLTRGGVSFTELPLPAAAGPGRSLLELGSSATGAQLEALWGALVAPWIDRIPGGTRQLVLVPDGPLHRVAFPLLHDGDAGRRLVDRYDLSWATTARADLGPVRVAAGSPAVILGPPAGKGSASLGWARREAAEIAALYPNPLLAAPKGATRREVAAALPAAAVFHLSGHARTGEGPGIPSSFELADGAFAAHDVEALALRHRPLAVLAACESAAGRPSRTEGVLSLARSFLAAGARAVIAPLGPLDDALGRELMVEIHRRLLAGESAETVLADLQREATADEPPERLRQTGSLVLLRGVRRMDRQEEER